MGHHVLALPGSLNIDGCEYSIENIDAIPMDFRKDKNTPISPRMITDFEKARKRAQRVDMVRQSLQKLSHGQGFFSSGCYLSNFFAYNFVCVILRRTRVSSSESANLQMPAKAKSLAHYITTTQEWENVKFSIMEKLLSCKFKHNKQLYYQLLNTRPHDLFECTMCEYWGTGWHFGSIAMEEKSWQENNHLGKVLMKVRSTFETHLVRMYKA